MGIKISHSRNEEIYGQDEPAQYIYKVLRGCVRTYKLLDDGRRQIGGFYLPGDVFGLESRSSHRFSAETIAETVLIAFKRTTLIALAQTDPVVAKELWQMTARELDHVNSQMVLLGRSSAQERVANFLVEMSNRSANRAEFELPMSRQDIADYLGLTIETVSRSITCIARKSLIELVSSRKVRVKNRAALKSFHQ
jgi:CRP/FNR family nitrogen fixation transcriptional regulator